MPNLPNFKECCGCGACVDACPKKAIELVEDKRCFYNIKIDKSACVECKLCEQRCHILHPELLIKSDPTHTQPIAAWSTTEELIKYSATGAIFAQIASNMLKEHGNTYVYGAALQNDNSVRHIEISNLEEIRKLQNSKYQQSYCVGIYSQVKKRLKEGSRVLFSGVPCQIAALYSFLRYNAQLIENLYTIEVLCHGVPCNDIHRVALKSHKAAHIYAYRNKDGRGWCGNKGNNNRLSYIRHNGERFIISSYQKDIMYRSYLSFNYSRPSCYSCRYANIHRVADLTIGDFWGWERTPNPEKYKNYWGTSVVLPNTDKGINMMKGNNLHCVETTWREFLPINQNLYMPTNIYDYKGYRYMSFVKYLPTQIKKIIYQSGFSNRRLNRLYEKFLSLVYRRKRRTAIAEKEKKSNYILKHLEK